MTTVEFHIHQCPFCELRFQNANEVRDHVVTDHHEHAPEFETATVSERPSEITRG